jgi:histidyl-tRNA synthetase
MAGTLRQAGYRVEYPLKAVGFSKQFKLAGQSGARLALIIGEEEAAQSQFKCRNMQSGDETAVPAGELLAWLQENL